ncbi:MAG: FAD-dependent oxidoreductase, partial [Brevinema sp.]
QALAGLGNEVVLSYRQDNFFRMNQLNKDLLAQLQEQKKVEVMLSSNIKSLQDARGKVQVLFADEQAFDVDFIVYSLGGASPVSFMDACGLSYDENNVNIGDFCESAIPGIFLAGDIVHGRKGGSLMLAYNNARSVVEGLHKKYNFPKPVSI